MFRNNFGDRIDAYDQEKKIFELADIVICLSKDTLQLVEEEYLVSKNKLRLIPNGLKDTKTISTHKKMKLRRKYNIPTDEKILLFAGRLHPIKGIFPLLSCFRKILKEHPSCRIVLVGDGDFMGSLKKCGDIWANVIFTGRLKQKELYNWYQIADIGLFLSYYEECSYVGIEMMMHGLPIIASDGYSVRNMFSDKGNAIVSKIGSQKKTTKFVQELESAMLSLLFFPDLCEKMSEKSRKMYKDIYSINRMKCNFKELFKVTASKTEASNIKK